jgi:hypothetical protein
MQDKNGIPFHTLFADALETTLGHMNRIQMAQFLVNAELAQMAYEDATAASEHGSPEDATYAAQLNRRKQIAFADALRPQIEKALALAFFNLNLDREEAEF